MHIYTLMFSAVCYFVALGVIEKDTPSRTDEIIKLVLWYLPLVIEVAAHFLLALRKDYVVYPPSAVFKRGITLFTVVLGAGAYGLRSSRAYIHVFVH